jgi:hypothetical protein
MLSENSQIESMALKEYSHSVSRYFHYHTILTYALRSLPNSRAEGAQYLRQNVRFGPVRAGRPRSQ